MYYTSLGIDDSKKAKQLKKESPWPIGSRNNEDIQKRIKAKYTPVDIYKKLDNKCNDFCGITQQHKLTIPYKLVHWFICICTPLIGSNDYYSLSYDDIADATAEKNKIKPDGHDFDLDYCLTLEANNELLPVPFDLTKFVNGGEDVAFSKRDAEDDLATESCVKCPGTAALFRYSSQDKKKPGKYFCVCNFNGSFKYETVKVSGNDARTDSKHSGPASAKYDEKIKKNYTPVNVYKKMDTSCKVLCAKTGKHQLYRHLESASHLCSCGDDKTIYDFSKGNSLHLHSRHEGLIRKEKDIKYFSELIAKKEMLGVQLITGRRFRK